MKKKIFYTVLSVFIFTIFVSNSPAVFAKSYENHGKNYTAKAIKDIRNVFINQVKFSNNNEIEKIKAFYAENYRNSDSFDKNTTFALVKENYDMYPDLKISLKINNIEVYGNYAIADIYEQAQADNLTREDIDYKGKLRAQAKTIYYLERIGNKWLITSEQSIYENNTITFGEADYADVKLSAPLVVPAGSEYSAKLEINNLPQTALVMGSITKSEATYPIPQDDDSDDPYRIFEEISLERVFPANKNNLNEYISGVLGITRSKPLSNGDIKLYMSGLAFLITKVNVLPENTKYIPATENVVEINYSSEFGENDSIEPDDILPDDNYVKESENIND